MSMTLAIEGGIASYVGVGATVTADGAGSEAARAAAIDVAAIFDCNTRGDQLENEK
jgi:hypothetical protein